MMMIQSVSNVSSPSSYSLWQNCLKFLLFGAFHSSDSSVSADILTVKPVISLAAVNVCAPLPIIQAVLPVSHNSAKNVRRVPSPRTSGVTLLGDMCCVLVCSAVYLRNPFTSAVIVFFVVGSSLFS
jgi:hypothetical protein